jgi:protein TonB
MLVLGVGFALDDAAPVLPTLDVILTQTQTAAHARAGAISSRRPTTRAAANTTRARAPRDAQTASPAAEPGVAAASRCDASRPRRSRRRKRA